ncbi:MAG TPA: hypothetical protein VHW44_30770 [Pseudonocardiaceae bacterium]|jgi:hypothetical protein|nr:hypothetical protein [Pseudonocardiaceae bacterium]
MTVRLVPRSLSRVLLGVLVLSLSVFLAGGIAVGTAAAAPVRSTAAVHLGRVSPVPVGELRRADTPTTTAPVTDINQEQQAANDKQAEHKAIVLGVVVVLLLIVYLGRRGKNRHRTKSKNAAQGKS